LRYDIFVTLWGKKFVDKYLTYSLTSQLAPGNLPALAADADIYYHIYTDRESEPYFHPAIVPLQNLAEVSFHYYDEIDYRDANKLSDIMENSDPGTIKHNVQGVTAQHFLAQMTQHSDAAAILLDSDFIISDGTFVRLHELRLQGKRAVSTLLLRLTDEGAGPLLKSDLHRYLNPRQLVGLALQHMHPAARSFFVDAENFTTYPHQLFWRVDQQVFVAHCLFPHPLMVIPDAGAIKFLSTMDYDYVLRAVSDDEAIHLCRSSDEMVVCKISPQSYLADESVEVVSGPRPTIEHMAYFVLNNSNLRHRIYLQQSVLFVAGGNENGWEIAERESRRFVEAIYKTIELMIANAPKNDPKSLVYLKSFLGPIQDFMSPQVQSRLHGWLPGKKSS